MITLSDSHGQFHFIHNRFQLVICRIVVALTLLVTPSLCFCYTGSQFEEHIVLAEYKADWQHCNKCKQLSVKAGESVVVLNEDDTGM